MRFEDVSGFVFDIDGTLVHRTGPREVHAIPGAREVLDRGEPEGFMRLLAPCWETTAVKVLMVVLSLCAAEGVVRAAVTARLDWGPSPDTNAVGYVLYHGVAGTSYLNASDVGNQTSSTLTNLVPGISNFFYVTAYDADRVEGEPSNLIATNFPGAYPSPTIAALPAQRIDPNACVGPLSLSIGDSLFDAASIKLSAASSFAVGHTRSSSLNRLDSTRSANVAMMIAKMTTTIA